MKKVWTYIFLLQSVLLFGQLDATADTEDFLAHAMIKNLSDQTIVIAWQRIENDLSQNWTSYICSNITCAPPEVAMGTFSLTAGDSTNLDCHFLPDGNPGEGLVQMKLFLTQDTSQIIFATYQGIASTVSTHAIESDPIKLYPNPASHHIYIDSEQAYTALLYSTQGVLIRKIKDTKAINISDLPQGVYCLLLYNEHQIPINSYTFYKYSTK